MTYPWLDQAKTMVRPYDRYKHCGGDHAAMLNRSTEGYWMHCFRCGAHEYVPRGTLTLAELHEIDASNKRAKDIENEGQDAPTLPKDFNYKIPTTYATWLYRAGISRDTAMEVGIGWSPYLSRIILPVYSTSGELLYWQGRAVLPGQKPKYINPRVKSRPLYYQGVSAQIPRSSQRIVLTEDILSCIRVGRFSPCAALLGTSISTRQALELSEFRRVSIWLDSDTAGQSARVKYQRYLSSLTSCDSLYSDKDPKCLSDREICEVLGIQNKDRYTYYGPIDIAGDET